MSVRLLDGVAVTDLLTELVADNVVLSDRVLLAVQVRLGVRV